MKLRIYGIEAFTLAYIFCEN